MFGCNFNSLVRFDIFIDQQKTRVLVGYQHSKIFDVPMNSWRQWPVKSLPKIDLDQGLYESVTLNQLVLHQLKIIDKKQQNETRPIPFLVKSPPKIDLDQAVYKMSLYQQLVLLWLTIGVIVVCYSRHYQFW